MTNIAKLYICLTAKPVCRNLSNLSAGKKDAGTFGPRVHTKYTTPDVIFTFLNICLSFLFKIHSIAIASHRIIFIAISCHQI